MRKMREHLFLSYFILRSTGGCIRKVDYPLCVCVCVSILQAKEVDDQDT